MSQTVNLTVASWTNARLLPLLALLRRLSVVPNLADAAAVRAWLRQLVALGSSGAGLLPEAVRRALELLKALVESDAAWQALYGLIQYFLSAEHATRVSGEDVLVVAEEPEVERRLGQLGGVMAAEASRASDVGSVWSAFDPTLILQIVAAIVALLKDLRKP